MDIIQTIERWTFESNYLCSILFLATNDGAQKIIERFEGKSIDEASVTEEQRG